MLMAQCKTYRLARYRAKMGIGIFEASDPLAWGRDVSRCNLYMGKDLARVLVPDLPASGRWDAN